MVYFPLISRSLSDKKQVDAIYVDFAKAFDRLPHKLLIDKLDTIGFPKWLIMWLESYLQDRTAFVRQGHIKSTTFAVPSGVPQGSHLGPLLFNLYMNDLCVLIDSEIIFYADDLKLYRTITDYEDCVKLQQDLDKLMVWRYEAAGICPETCPAICTAELTLERTTTAFPYDNRCGILKTESIGSRLLLLRRVFIFDILSGNIDMLSTGDDPSSSNVTVRLVNVSETCGANYAAPVDRLTQPVNETNTNFHQPDPARLNMLTGIFLGCMALASISVAVGVDSLQRYSFGRTGSGSGISGIRMLIITAKHLTNKYQLLLLPITMFIGLEQAFIAVDFTASFVACGIGISKIGYAMISFGLANAVAAAVTPYITKTIGRFPMILGTAVFHVVLIVFMLTWKATDQDYVYPIIAACWGLADGVWLIQINALSGILFPGNEEAAFSNFRLWEATGSVLMYATSPFLSTFTKLVCIVCIMLIGTVGYTSIEVMEYRLKKSAAGKRFEMIEPQEKEI
ncbi:UNC93-like protein [Uranotaenia lowii]|uniref:UNC93-like protein n=1 Tax=Uranotaenia lowii TaxID=190385 RepID=UPI002478E44B|nr:UNC93-like protein [Uranotaenia lowii]